MSRTKSSARRRLSVILGVATAAALLVAPAAEAAKPKKGEVTVMSRNLYLGADLTPALEAGTPEQLAFAAQQIWNTVAATDFPDRAKLVAKEIDGAKPDLVGLQEVALWRADRSGSADGPTTPAEQVEYDFLALLMKQLNKGDGPQWTVVRQQREIDIETPLSGVNPVDGRLTMRDVVLKRKGSAADVQTSFDYSNRFDKDNSLVIENIGGTPLDITVFRGYVAMDADVRGTQFRFVNTHLEAFDNTAKLAQAEQLVASLAEVAGGFQNEIGPANPGGTDLPIVLVGDLNTDDEIVETEGDTPQHQADELPYAEIVDAGLEERSFDGLNTDGDDEQYSCCFGDETIMEAPATALADIDHTVDHVMVEDDDHGAGTDPNSNDITLVDSFATGDDPDEYSRFNIWGSDHLGVVSTLKFPTP